MKHYLVLLATTIFCWPTYSQSLGKIANLKDAWDLSISYTGEIKDGKPNGMGVATYGKGNVLRYVGQFVNGLYEGKGTMLFGDGAFLTGHWRNGKLDGRGANLTANGSLYLGEFRNGVKNGAGVLIYKDNDFTKGHFKNDKIDGRSIRVWSNGTIVSDVYYSADKMHGPGYQYETKAKKLYEGEWKEDKWQQAVAPGFSSFLKSPTLTAESVNNHILLGPVNSSKFLMDTAYYYDMAKKKRFFGYYENGRLRHGLVIRDDSSRFYGKLNDKGATGYCYDFKFESHYSEGNYVDDQLNGYVVDIDLKKKSVYMGETVNGKFTGKAHFFNASGTMFMGDYQSGKFTGTGTKIYTTGKIVSGTWKDGSLVTLQSLTNSKGDKIAGSPKTFNEGINIVIKTYIDYFDDVVGDPADFDFGDDPDPDVAELVDFGDCIMAIPGSIGKNMIASDFDLISYWYAKFMETPSRQNALIKYNALAAQLLAVPISTATTPKAKLVGKTEPPREDGSATSLYTIDKPGRDLEGFKVWVSIHKKSNNMYVVSLRLSEIE